MKLTDQQLARFGNMVGDFAKKNGLTVTMETDCLDMGRTDVTMSNGYTWRKYVTIWREVSSLTDAATQIFTDASIQFNLVKHTPAVSQFDIQRVLFNDPATIVFWKDGTKTVVKCQDGDVYSEEVGLALCFAKKALGNQSNFNNVFKKWLPEETTNTIDDGELRESLANAASSSSIAAGVMAKFHEAMEAKRKADEFLKGV